MDDPQDATARLGDADPAPDAAVGLDLLALRAVDGPLNPRRRDTRPIRAGTHGIEIAGAFQPSNP